MLENLSLFSTLALSVLCIVMNMANLFATEVVGGVKGNIVSVMVGVTEQTRMITFQSNPRIFIIHFFISNKLMERIVGHKGESKTVI